MQEKPELEPENVERLEEGGCGQADYRERKSESAGDSEHDSVFAPQDRNKSGYAHEYKARRPF